MTVYGYTRVSTAEQAADDRSSLDTQRRKITAAAEAYGVTVDAFVDEPGVSGSKPLTQRPAGGPLVASLVRGDVLIVAKMDRLFRSVVDGLNTADDLRSRRVDLIIADMSTEPVTQNGVARIFFTLLASFAEFERDRIRERMGDGRAGKKRGGGHIGGATPFGYTKIGAGKLARLEPEPKQQAAIATMRELSASGMASRAISAAVLERHGLKVSHVTVARLASETNERSKAG